ncbi:MAG: hypothetical protein HY060_15880 [Proteobacteria bacterium]|nr:hypothetical protein [Pseudomonadota bacterium]
MPAKPPAKTKAAAKDKPAAKAKVEAKSKAPASPKSAAKAKPAAAPKPAAAAAKPAAAPKPAPAPTPVAAPQPVAAPKPVVAPRPAPAPKPAPAPIPAAPPPAEMTLAGEQARLAELERALGELSVTADAAKAEFDKFERRSAAVGQAGRQGEFAAKQRQFRLLDDRLRGLRARIAACRNNIQRLSGGPAD